MLLAGCAADDVSADPAGGVAQVAPLRIAVQQASQTKTQIVGTYLPDLAELGVFIRSAEGTAYDDSGLQSVCYKASGVGAEQQWTAESEIQLSGTVGKAYAFYPYRSLDGSELKVPITNDGTDWMYGSAPEANLSAANSQAQFSLNHAMAIIRCRLVKGDYYDPGTITSIGLQSVALATGAIMDLESASLTDFEEVGSLMTVSDVGVLGDTPLSVEWWAVPTETVGSVRFRVEADGNVYTAETSAVELVSGKVYQYVLSVHSNTLEVSTVSVQPWSSFDQGTSSPSIKDPWDFALANNGVYAIDSYGNPIPYEEVSGSDYLAVAFVVRGQAYQVAKVNAKNENGEESIYFWKTGYKDLDGLTNHLMLDANCDNGYLDGTTSPQLLHDPNEWTFGSISDFNGAQNTAVIMEGQKVDGVLPAETIGKAVEIFRADNTCNEGVEDWFVPACGELAYMYLKRDEINTLILRIGGQTLGTATFWSSSEHANTVSWILKFSNGNVLGKRRLDSTQARLIRKM